MDQKKRFFPLWLFALLAAFLACSLPGLAPGGGEDNPGPTVVAAGENGPQGERPEVPGDPPAALPPVEIAGGIGDPGSILQPGSLPLPPAGTVFRDPVFGTAIRRVSDSSAQGGFETHSYSQLQAFSSDNRYLLLEGSNGFIVRRTDDFSIVAGLDTSGWNNPRWHPRRPGTILHFDSNEDTTLRLQSTEVENPASTTLFTFPPQYQYIRVPQSFDELSRDGRWLGGLATREDGVAVIFALDIENGVLGAQLPVPDLYRTDCLPDPEWGDVEPDWIGVSPLGRSLVVQWVRDWDAGSPTPRCSGLETFDLQSGAFIGRVSPHHGHGDLGVGADGAAEFFMTVELSSPEDPNNPAIAMRLLPGTDTASEPIFLQTVGWSDLDHISCQGPPGVCLVSWGNFDSTYDFPFENELFLLYTNGAVRRLAHHRSSKCGYWVQPRASISADGRFVIFASDWGEAAGRHSCGGGNDLGLSDPYVIDLTGE